MVAMDFLKSSQAGCLLKAELPEYPIECEWKRVKDDQGFLIE